MDTFQLSKPKGNDSTNTSEKNSADMTRFESESTTRVPSLVDPLERPQGPQRSDTQNEAMASLAAAEDPDHKPKKFSDMWPKDWRAYLCLFGGFCQMFISWGYVNAFGTYASYYDRFLLPDADNLLMNLIGGTMCFVILLLSFVIGRLVDAGHIRMVLCVGTVFLAAGTFSLGAVNGEAKENEGNYGGIWATQGFLTGLGMACHFVSSSQVVSTWFIDTKSFAVGFVACGASVGGAVISTMARYLNQSMGFNNASNCVAALVTGMSVLTIFICRPNPEHPHNKSTKWRFSTFWDNSAFHNACFNWLSAAVFFIFLGFYPVFFNLEDWAANMGVAFSTTERPLDISPNAIETFALLSFMNGSSFIGRLVSAGLSDHLGEKYGALHVHAVVTFVCSILLLAFWTTAKTVATAIGFVVVFGVFSGAVIGLPAASMAFVIGKRDTQAQAKLGQRVGMMYTMAAIPALIGPIIVGHLITRYNSFLTAQLWTGGSLMASAVCMCVCAYYERRQRKRRQSAISVNPKLPFDSSFRSIVGLRRKEG
ncbi:hypothetical protein LTR22_025397 [Elasticomyces elasticus]|nr:hypothetical protein LTR22_025397 [Elasticomyces elasticus]KAK4904733.1 hypothetical protein LTR49_025869 [Elasticomyces elasticus]KAK5741246.1 hypothetical protein LTS12_024677 [Elasticomyces elasticus]